MAKLDEALTVPIIFFFSSRRRHTRLTCDWSSDVCSSDLTVREVVCMACGERAPMERALDRVRAGEADPPCRSCGGILKSATISFGQNLVEADLLRAGAAARNCD